MYFKSSRGHRSLDKFIRQTQATVIDQRKRYRSNHNEQYSITRYDPAASIRNEVVESIVLEIDIDSIEEYIFHSDRLFQQLEEFTCIVDKNNNDRMEFHEFFKQNPALAEQYAELMSLCKMAGLKWYP